MRKLPHVKICGVTDETAVATAASAGATYIGFVFFPKSPRHLSLAKANDLAALVPAGVTKTALTVNADDAQLERLLAEVPLDALQLHGGESPERVEDVKALSGLPVIKAVGIANAADLAKIDLYEPVADILLIDAKPPKEAALPGGNGLTFDWRLIADRRWKKPWLLAGGLTPDTVAEAIRLTGAPGVDVSSGVEKAPGVKDPDLIVRFIAAARDAQTA